MRLIFNSDQLVLLFYRFCRTWFTAQTWETPPSPWTSTRSGSTGWWRSSSTRVTWSGKETWTSALCVIATPLLSKNLRYPLYKQLTITRFCQKILHKQPTILDIFKFIQWFIYHLEFSWSFMFFVINYYIIMELYFSKVYLGKLVIFISFIQSSQFYTPMFFLSWIWWSVCSFHVMVLILYWRCSFLHFRLVSLIILSIHYGRPGPISFTQMLSTS